MTEWVAVTGPSRGIGRATALALGARGKGVALLGRCSPELDAVVERLQALRAPVELIEVDLSSPEAVDRAGRTLVDRCGPPLALVNNAGTITRCPVEGMTIADWDRQLRVNLCAPFLLSKAVVPGMRRSGRGRIIHIGSIASTLGTARATAYCASKWGLVGFMKALAEELSGSGLMTAAILPGSVDTDMLVGSGFAPAMTAEDVAATVVHFALDAPVAHNGAVVEMFGV